LSHSVEAVVSRKYEVHIEFQGGRRSRRLSCNLCSVHACVISDRIAWLTSHMNDTRGRVD